MEIPQVQKKIKQIMKEGLYGVLYFFTKSRNKGIKAILLYHSVNIKEIFKKQMLHLKKNFRFVLLKDLKKEILKKKEENLVCCTFDDGRLDNYNIALPILEDLDLKATFFIATGYIGKYIPTSFGEKPMMDNHQILELFSLGHEIGAHSVNHLNLTKIPLAETKKEISQSKSYLENLIGAPVVSFAYPFGMYNKTISNLVKEAGFLYGVTIKEALLKDENINWLELPRIGIDETIGMFQFRGKVSFALGVYETLRRRK